MCSDFLFILVVVFKHFTFIPSDESAEERRYTSTLNVMCFLYSRVMGHLYETAWDKKKGPKRKSRRTEELEKRVLAIRFKSRGINFK